MKNILIGLFLGLSIFLLLYYATTYLPIVIFALICDFLLLIFLWLNRKSARHKDNQTKIQ
jgi:uncharacterized membrane protein YjgN (DUF898 family)